MEKIVTKKLEWCRGPDAEASEARLSKAKRMLNEALKLEKTRLYQWTTGELVHCSTQLLEVCKVLFHLIDYRNDNCLSRAQINALLEMAWLYQPIHDGSYEVNLSTANHK